MVRILIGLLAAVVIAAGVGWWVSTHSDAPARFESCHVKDGVQVTLDYIAGAGDRVTATADPQKDAIVVSLDRDTPSGVRPAVALPGQFSFEPFGGVRGRSMQYPDGTLLRCPRS